jgi:nicotinamide phosphoribosyltransferase
MISPLFYIDFYKVGHVSQYPSDVTQVWSNWTPRSSRVSDQKTVFHFGLQYFLKDYLGRRFQQGFFGRPLETVLAEYREVIRATLGVANPRTDHIEWLHRLGYLPLAIYSIPEGCSVPLNVPSIVLTNTLPRAFWLPNYLETILSAVLWKPCTSATTAQRYRRLFIKYAQEAGETDLSFVDWMGHDFSFRGMSGLEDGILSGMAHLLSFSGTDTIPAIMAAREFYGAELSIGGSVPATEHSVMSAGCQDGELETFRRLIEDIYPSGIVSIVSDTWDLWRVLTEYIPALKEKILGRDGKLVIRPDSGDPVKILCGDPDVEGPAQRGTLQLLAAALGVDANRPGLPLINKGAAIYGDSITVERANAILSRTIRGLKLSPYNLVFGIGSFTYEYVTRDTYGFAMKATAVRRNGEIVPIFKCPVTDNGGKFSHKGIPAVYEGDAVENPGYYVIQGATEGQLENCALEKVFCDGELLIEHSFEQIRRRVRA